MGSGGCIVDLNGGQQRAWRLLHDGIRRKRPTGLWADDLGLLGRHVEVRE